LVPIGKMEGWEARDVGKCKAKTNCALGAQFGDPSYRKTKYP
jgi:hypothetical protein